jgi:hypothetical protein
MSNTPPQRPVPGDGPQAAARGVLRDALGGLHNLVQLLHSIRVGPKALTAVIPDVQASCAAMRGAVRELLDEIASEFPNPTATDELAAFFEPRINELERSLTLAARTPINARARLDLENVLGRLSRELDAARELLDLLEDAVEGPTVRLSLLEIVRHGVVSPDRHLPQANTLSATISSTPEGLELLVNSRVARALVITGANLVSGGDPGVSLELLIGRLDGNESGMRVQRGTSGGERIVVPVRALIPPTLPCVEAAARLAGARIERSPDDSRFSVLWPREAGAARPDTDE